MRFVANKNPTGLACMRVFVCGIVDYAMAVQCILYAHQHWALTQRFYEPIINCQIKRG